jgi:hypothetical protein
VKHVRHGRDRLASVATERRAFPQMDRLTPAREGETALSPKRNLEWPLGAAKEGVHGGTMGSPTFGYDSIVDSVRAAAS